MLVMKKYWCIYWFEFFSRKSAMALKYTIYLKWLNLRKRGFVTFLVELRISNSLAKDFLYIIFIAKISALIYCSFRNVFWKCHFSTTFCIHYRSEKTYEEYQLFFIGVHAPVGGHIALWLIMIANFSLYF